MSKHYQRITSKDIAVMSPFQRLLYRVHEYVKAATMGIEYACLMINLTNGFISDAISGSCPESLHTAQDTHRRNALDNNAQKATELHLRKYERG